MSMADTGYVAQWHDLLNEVRQKDAALHSLLQTRETALLSRGWDVAPFVAAGLKESKKRDEKIAAFCKDALAGACGFNRALSHLLDANYKGFSVVETTWKKRSDGKVVPVEFTAIQGRRWFVEETQDLTLYDDGVRIPRADVIRQYPGRFLCHKPRVNGDQLAREGLGRCLIWYSAFGTWAWRDWMMFAELFGKPNRHVEYDPETYQSDTDEQVKAALDAMSSSGYAIFPKGAQLKTEWPAGGKGGASPADTIIEKAAEWMALAVIGQRQTISKVSGGLGGNGDVRDLVRKDILKADDEALGETIREQLFVPLVAMNFGPKAAASFFGFDVEDPSDLNSFADAIGKLKLADLKIPTAYVYETTGIPKPIGDEPTLGSDAIEDAAEAQASGEAEGAAVGTAEGAVEAPAEAADEAAEVQTDATNTDSAD
jgi:phage gp29-like protein